MPVNVDIQVAIDDANVPALIVLDQWARYVLSRVEKTGSLTIRIVDEAEMQQLNTQFRQKPCLTNVLSFPFEAPPGVNMTSTLFGDVVICHAVVENEAKQQDKSIQAHYAHMVIHGILHLLGFDHIKQRDALKMEGIEVELLVGLGFSNPYQGENR